VVEEGTGEECSRSSKVGHRLIGMLHELESDREHARIDLFGWAARLLVVTEPAQNDLLIQVRSIRPIWTSLWSPVALKHAWKLRHHLFLDFMLYLLINIPN
jgi:hypothetical protein